MYVRLLLGLLFILGCANLANASPFAYVANYNGNSSGKGITIIDLATNNVSGQISLPNPLNRPINPYGVAVNKFGSHVYVSNAGDTNVFDIDTATNTVTTISMPYIPSGLAVSPAGTRLYVAHANNAALTVYDLVNKVIVKTVTTGTGPQGVAVSPAGDRVYVANSSVGTVSVFNAAADGMGVLQTVTVSTLPMGIAVSPDSGGSKVYVACTNAGVVDVIDASNYGVTTIPSVGTMPTGIAVNAANSKLYVTLAGESNVAVYNLPANSSAGKIAVGTSPMGISITTDDAKFVTANSSANTASIITTNNGSPVATPAVDSNPQSIGNFIGPELIAITVNAGANGTITAVDPITVNPTTNILLAPRGRDLALNITPANQYAIASVTLDGVAMTVPYVIPNVQGPHTVAATFVRTYTVYLNKSGSGTGSVSSSTPPAFDCGTTCTSAQNTYRPDQQSMVTMKAAADATSAFQGWMGSNCRNIGLCTITFDGIYADVDGNYYVTASFALNRATTLYALYSSQSVANPADATYAENFNADQTKTFTITPASPSTTITPANTASPTFMVSYGTIIFSGGGSFVIN